MEATGVESGKTRMDSRYSNNTTEPVSLADQIERMGHQLTANQLADILTVSRITILKQAGSGRIPSFRIGTCVRFDPRSVASKIGVN